MNYKYVRYPCQVIEIKVSTENFQPKRKLMCSEGKLKPSDKAFVEHCTLLSVECWGHRI